MSPGTSVQASGKRVPAGIVSHRTGTLMTTSADTIETGTKNGNATSGSPSITAKRDTGPTGKNLGKAAASRLTIHLNRRRTMREATPDTKALAKMNAISTQTARAPSRPATGSGNGLKIKAEPNRMCRATAIVNLHDGLGRVNQMMSGRAAMTDRVGVGARAQLRREPGTAIGERTRNAGGQIARASAIAKRLDRPASAARKSLGSASKADLSRIENGMKIDLRT